MPSGAAASSGVLTYTLFDPAGCGFPAPRVPLLPMFTMRALGGARTGDFDLVGAGRPRRVYKRGRYALYDAYRLCGVGPDGTLLAPAYHCRTMLDPAISLGADLALYPVDRQLVPDLDALRRLVAAARRPVRAMLLTHYFGFAQPAATIKAFCDEHDIALIEDCSHALFNLRGRERLGQHGRYTIASPYKLFPCEEGGLLIPGPGRTLAPNRNRPAGLRAELRVVVSALQRSLARRRVTLGDIDEQALDGELRRVTQQPAPPAARSVAAVEGTSAMYLPSEEGLAGPAAARWLMRLCNVGDVARRRRDNYRRWVAEVRALPHCHALFPVLPDDAVPYMFPLFIDHPEPHFYRLKQLGMPIWRWDEMAVSSCRVALEYSRHVLHLPCHQALSDAELQWMIAAVSRVLQSSPLTA
jgi:perosamine synthetase